MYSTNSQNMMKAMSQNNMAEQQLSNFKERTKSLNQGIMNTFNEKKQETLQKGRDMLSEKIGLDESQAKLYGESAVALAGSRGIIRSGLQTANVKLQNLSDVAKNNSSGVGDQPDDMAGDVELTPLDSSGKSLAKGSVEEAGEEVGEGAGEELGVEAGVEAGLVASSTVEMASGIGVVAGLATLGGLAIYDAFHKAKRESLPSLPQVAPPVLKTVSSGTSQSIRNSFVSPSLESAVDTAGSNGSF